MPYLLRHLSALDFRGNRYEGSLVQLLRVLREEPLPRPRTLRGQAVTATGRIDRSTLVAEWAVTEAEPDVVTERLFCNLLPVEELPALVYSAPIAKTLRIARIDDSETLPSKEHVKAVIWRTQQDEGVERPFMPAFRMRGDRILTFHELRASEGPLHSAIEPEDVEATPIEQFLDDEDDRKVVVSLLNMAISRHARRCGLVIDEAKNNRYFFPPKNGGNNVYGWVPRRTRARRTVAKPLSKDGKVQFWRHLGAYLKIVYLTGTFYLQITPTSVFTKDGEEVETGPSVGRLAIRWQGAERNLNVLFHVRFWSTVLRQQGRRAIRVRAGDQWMGILSVPATVQLPYGIANDQKDLLGQLDTEASLIAEEEEQLVDLEAEEIFARAGEVEQDEVEDELEQLADVDEG